MKDFFTGYDFLLSVFWLLVIYLFAISAVKYKNDRKEYKKHIIPGLTVKILGGISVGLIYNYYYGFGDTLRYYNLANSLTRVAYESPGAYLELLFSSPDREAWNYTVWSEWIEINSLFFSDSTLLVVKLVSLIQLVSLGGYIPITILIAAFTFIFYYSFYIFICKKLNFYHPLIAISVFYIPSVFLWGSAILKDSFCNISVLQIILSVYAISVERRNVFSNTLLILFSGFIIFTIKPYILLALIPGVLLFIIRTISITVRPGLAKLVLIPFIFISVLAVGLGGFFFLAEQSQRFSLENVEKYSEMVRTDLTKNESYYTKGIDSRYTLFGEDLGPAGQPLMYVSAFFTAYFRPFIWEANNVLSLISALELICIAFVFYYYRKKPYISHAARPNRIALFRSLLVFIIVFGVAVGLTSGNFGNLVRYRIPALPFILIVLMAFKVNKTAQPVLAITKNRA